MRQAGAWDPWLRCLHLDTPLLQQRNKKKPSGTKKNCEHMHSWGKFWTTRYTDQKTTSEEPGAKGRILRTCPLHSTPAKGLADHL